MVSSFHEFKNLKIELQGFADKQNASRKLQFFQTEKGKYGEGDQFLGISVPDIRKIGKKYHKALDLDDIRELLFSAYNEERLLGLLILIDQIGKLRAPKEVYDFYVKHIDRVNNWNLVDASARPIVGAYLMDKDRSVLDDWARSENLWVRRIAIVASWHFIKCGEFQDTLRISILLMKDKQDLIHKAVGWMLRELGKQNQEVLKVFLKKYQKEMPRTMLRYAIERLKALDKEQIMQGTY